MGDSKKVNIGTGSFKEKKELFQFFEKYIILDSSLYIAVSGGADSMLLATLIIDYISYTGQDLSTITILHVNHKTRPETDNEELFIKQYFRDFRVVSFTYKGHKKTEEILRNIRKEFFKKELSKEKKQPILLTGHNLTDRIETSILHMIRGAGIGGIQNMQEAEIIKTTYGLGKELNPNISNNKKPSKEFIYLLLRPLLSLPKDHITEICKKYKIPYMQDMSNFDSKTSKRNRLRNEILPQLIKLGGSSSGSSFWNSRKLLYSFLDTQAQPIWPIFYNLSGSVYRGDYSKYLRFEIPKSIYETIYLLKELDIYNQKSASFLQIFYKFLTAGKQGHLVFNNHYFFIAHHKLYVISSNHEFWKEEMAKERSIDKLGKYDLGDFTREIIDKKLIGGKIRFPKEGDHWKGKRLKKQLLNKKIPLFWRNYIPVIEKNKKIVDIFPHKELSGYY